MICVFIPLISNDYVDGKYALLTLFGIVLVAYAIVNTPLSQHYVSALAEWNYMRNVTVDVPSYAVGVTYVAEMPLPDDDDFWSHVSPDCSDVRVTYGSGTSESILPSYVVSCDPDDKEGRVSFLWTPQSTTEHLRLYYGNPYAVAPEPFAPSEQSYTPHDYRDDFAVTLCDGADQWGIMVLHKRDVYLLKWGEGCGLLRYNRDIPVAYSVSFRIDMDTWGHGWAYFPAGDCSVDPTSDLVSLVSSCPDGMLIHAIDDQTAEVSLYRAGDVVDTINVSRRFDVVISAVEGGTRYVVAGHTLGVVPAELTEFRAYASSEGSQSTRIKLSRYKVEYHSMCLSASDVEYSEELLSPRAPVVEITAPEDGEYYNTSDGEYAYSVVDPNDDLSSVTATLAGDVVSTEFSDQNTVTLSDGEHVFEVVAEDSEGIRATSTVTFHVDTVAPVLEVNVNGYEDGNLLVSLSASDPNLLGCYYAYAEDGEPVQIPCDGDVNIPADYDQRVYVFALDLAGNTTVSEITAPSRPLPPSSGGSGCECVRVVFAGATQEQGETPAPEDVVRTVQPASPVGTLSPEAWAIAGVVLLLVVMVALSHRA